MRNSIKHILESLQGILFVLSLVTLHIGLLMAFRHLEPASPVKQDSASTE